MRVRLRFCALALLLFLTACAVSRPFGGPPAQPKPPADAPLRREVPGTPPVWQVDEALLTDDYLISLVLDKEAALNNGGFTFSDPEELTNDQLYICFLLLTSHEECSQFLRKGVWQGMETDLFYIPEDFILTRLSEHFKQFHFDITKEGSHYDPETNCFVTPTVTGFGGGPGMQILSKSIEGSTVTFTGGLYAFYHPERGPYLTKTYTIEFYDGGYYYLSAIETE